MKKSILAILGTIALTLPWIIIRSKGIAVSPISEALFSGLAIVGGAFILSWAAEVAEMDVPKSASLALVALIAVLPEYAVDLYFAWQAGKYPALEYRHYAIANMTGANRLLIGIGWALVVLFAAILQGKKEVELKERLNLETFFLLIATLYAFVLPLKDSISLFDSLVFISIYICYIFLALKSPYEEPELIGVPSFIGSFTKGIRRSMVICMFLFSGYVIYISVEAFAEGLIEVGMLHGLDPFLMVQWIAPLASESPELIVACYMVKRLRATSSMNVLISSKLNQWTLLVGTLPIVYSIALGEPSALVMDARQREEVLLTAAQSLFGVAVISNLRISVLEAIFLSVLFLGQLAIPEIGARYVFSGVYIILALAWFFREKKLIDNISYLRKLYKT